MLGNVDPSVLTTVSTKTNCHWTLHIIKTNTKLGQPSMYCVQVVKVIFGIIIIFFNLFRKIAKNTAMPRVEILPEVSDVNANLDFMAK